MKVFRAKSRNEKVNQACDENLCAPSVPVCVAGRKHKDSRQLYSCWTAQPLGQWAKAFWFLISSECALSVCWHQECFKMEERLGNGLGFLTAFPEPTHYGNLSLTS